MSAPTIEELYIAYDIVKNKTGDAEKRKESYLKIMEAVNGDEKEKRLASQFIVYFFEMFSDLYEEAFNKLLDLCEEENITIRKQVIMLLPTVAKKVPSYLSKAADTLTQMLMTDDVTEISMLGSSLSTIMRLDTKGCLEAVLGQLLTQLDEAAEIMNTHAFRWLAERLAALQQIDADVETLVETQGAKLMEKVAGREELPLVVGILACLKGNSTVVGRQKLIGKLCEGARAVGSIVDARKLGCLVGCCREATKLLSKNVQADDMVLFVLENVEAASKLDEDALPMSALLQCLVDLVTPAKAESPASGVSKPDFSSESALAALHTLVQLAFDKVPELPEEISEEGISKLSEDVALLMELEKFLLAVYSMCKLRPDALILDEKKRSRLQFLGRINQAAHKRAAEALAKLTAAQRALDDSKEVVTLPRITGNIQILVREFFKTPASFKVLITPSWVAPAVVVGEKRVVPGAVSNTARRTAKFPARVIPGNRFYAGPNKNGAVSGFKRRR